jgi:hypothetical protein
MMISCPSCSQETSDKELFCQQCNTQRTDSAGTVSLRSAGDGGRIIFFNGVLYNFTLTTNLNTWYSHLMLIALLAAFTAYAFKTSLAGERLFKGNLLED